MFLALAPACSFFGPASDEYARQRPNGEAGSEAVTDAGTGPLSDAGADSQGEGGASEASGGKAGDVSTSGSSGTANTAGSPQGGGDASNGGASGAGSGGASAAGGQAPSCAPTDCNDNNPCTVDSCSNGSCSHLPGNAGAVCRDIAGDCDVVEKCSGTSALCPSDGFKTSASTCRPATSVCDKAETCTGSSASCPADLAAKNGISCDDGQANTCNDACSAGVCVGSTSCSPCTGICANPASIDGNNNPGTGGAICYQRSNANGANVGGVAGKGLEVNGQAVASDGNVSPWPAKVYGGYCFKSNAGFGWLSLF